MDAFRIRPAILDDLCALLPMLNRMLEEYPQGYSRRWMETADGQAYMRFHIERGWVLVAEVGARVVGHCAWTVRYAQPQHDYIRYAEIRTVYVLEAFRASGIAAALCNAMLEHCLRNALSVVSVHAVPDPEVVSLFTRLGFVERRRVMERRVSSPRAD